MSVGNTPGSATPDPKEAREPPDFASNPQEAYPFVCSVPEESIAAMEKPETPPSIFEVLMEGEENDNCCSIGLFITRGPQVFMSNT